MKSLSLPPKGEPFTSPALLKLQSHIAKFSKGQLVSVDWERLGEIEEVLPNGYYRVWVEGEYQGGASHTIFQSHLELFQVD